MKDLRRRFRKRDRLHLHGVVEYRCDCGAGLRVAVSTAVMSDVPAPEKIPCSWCDGESQLVEGSYEKIDGELLESQRMPYLRIPSRRAMARLIHHARFEAQLVLPQEDRRGGIG